MGVFKGKYGLGVVMSIKERIVKILERELEDRARYVDLEKLSEEEREKCFAQFGEGDENLTRFLKTAFEHGAPSLFCCSGHGTRSAYVVLRVTEDNIELLRKIGRVLSKDGVATNFLDDIYNGAHVDYRLINSASTEWLNTASQIIEKPELFDDNNPKIYYHEKMVKYRPFAFELKKRILAYLRGDMEELPVQECNEKKKVLSCVLSEEEKDKINERSIKIARNVNEAVVKEKTKKER